MTKGKAASKSKIKDTIDLNRILVPDERVLNAYKSANAMHLFFPYSPWIVNEERVFTASNCSDPPAEIHQQIISLYRKKVGSKEYLLMHNRLWTFDFFKNIVEHVRGPLGMVEIPVIVRRKSINPNTIRSDTDRVSPSESEPEISHNDTVYLWEFEKYIPQLQEWYRDGTIPATVNMYYWVEGAKFKVSRFEDFINLSGDDLILLGKVGHRFSGVLKEGDATSIDVLRTLLKEEIQKGLLSTQK